MITVNLGYVQVSKVLQDRGTYYFPSWEIGAFQVRVLIFLF